MPLLAPRVLGVIGGGLIGPVIGGPPNCPGGGVIGVGGQGGCFGGGPGGPGGGRGAFGEACHKPDMTGKGWKIKCKKKSYSRRGCA